jgi:hypothetical protein
VRVRLVSTVVCLAALSALLVAGRPADAATGVSIRPGPGAPDPRLMVLTATDLGPGARVTTQHYYKDADFPSVISYSRELEGGRVGSTRFLSVDSEAEVGTSARSTRGFIGAVRQLLGSKAARKALAQELAAAAGDGTVTVLSVGAPRNVGVGPGSFDLLVSLRVLGRRADLHVAVFSVERTLGDLTVLGAPGAHVSLAVMTRLARIQAAHTSAQLLPKNTVLPTVSGTAVVGQTLTAAPGAWSGGATSFSYQWQRCDATGAGCSDIAGATGPTYVPVASDVGSTLRVVVTAGSALGSAAATSAQTLVVSAAGSPTNTSPPTIVGAAQAGQSLTAGTGTWAGNPTSFAFQWQRCDAAGASCADIVGATSGTYVVGSTDRGSTLRVAVTAQNAVGTGTAVSAPTAVVP